VFYAAAAYLDILDRIDAGRLDANVSLKLTQLGLDVDAAACERHLREIVARAAAHGSFVRIDMESSAYTARTLALFRRVYADFPRAVGPVIQAYLYRSAGDVNDLIRLGARVRLCKGAYAEPPAVAYPSKRDVDRSFRHLADLLIPLGNYPAIATHDVAMIDHAKRAAAEFEIDRGAFEFQLLYGVRRDLQQRLVDEGYRVRAYVPFGAAWYPYLTRRLAERPANALFVLRNLASETLGA
jgi:proline dehydrogenase